MRLRNTCIAICAVAVVGGAPAAASAQGSGGTTVESGTPAPPVPVAVKKKAIRDAPITARTTNIAYRGPVYVRKTDGQVVPYVPASSRTSTVASNGGATFSTYTPAREGLPQLLVPGERARYIHGLAAAPMRAPAAVQEMIWTGNHLIGKPYIYGGGHASFISRGYDCSGSVSFALHGGGRLEHPEDSTEFESYGKAGIGRWVTIFANAGHAYMTIAGLRLDTSPAFDPSNLEGPRWRPLRPENSGFVKRHPVGL